MGQAIGGISGAAALSAPASRADDIGAYLARQRKLRGISLDELESLTHIPRRSLERLEAGAYDGDPDGFVRGFVRTVSLAIGLDPEEAVSRMLEEPSSEGPRQQVSLPRVLLALVLVLGGALALALAPGVLETQPAAPPPRVVSEAPAVRWDAVRELAEAVAAASSLAPPPAAAEVKPGPVPEPGTSAREPGLLPEGRPVLQPVWKSEAAPGPLPWTDGRDPHGGAGPSGG
jgi:cytoskeletal protein RodZ